MVKLINQIFFTVLVLSISIVTSHSFILIGLHLLLGSTFSIFVYCDILFIYLLLGCFIKYLLNESGTNIKIYSVQLKAKAELDIF